MTKQQELHISRLGSQGDGISETEHGEVYVPLTLPGETVIVESVDDKVDLISILKKSDDRIEAECPHYYMCGGCSLQHLSNEAYTKWKQQKVKQAFSNRGIEVDIEPIYVAPKHSRRRTTLGMRRTKKTTLLGYHSRRSHELIDISNCLIIKPEIEKQFENLKALLRPLTSRKGEIRITVTHTLNGLDVSLEYVSKRLDAQIRGEIAELARKFGISRLTIEKEIIFAQNTPQLQFGNVTVDLAPGAFLQAVKDAENYIADIITREIGTSKKVADLFCGMGTFTFPIAQKSEVTAIEYDEIALKYLDKTYRNTQNLKPITTELRDLFQDPLSAKELEKFDAVIFDPPRAGAKAQSDTLAQSSVPIIVAVSCNPSTLTRDLRILIDGGYKIKQVKPIDQFLFSPHVEVITVLHR